MIKLSYSAVVDSYESLSTINSPSIKSSSVNSVDNPTDFIIKQNPVDLDYNLNLLSRFEHPNSLMEPKIDTAIESSRKSDLNEQLIKSSNLRPLSRRIRFLVGPNTSFEKQSNDEDQLTNMKRSSDLNNYSAESIESILQSNNLDDQYSARNQRNQPADVFRHRTNRLNNLLLQNQLNQFTDPSEQQVKSRRIKKALSLFAHWKPVASGGSSYTSGHSSQFMSPYKHYGKMSSRSNYRPIGQPQPLRWG